ncbi:MAG: YdcF family protein [Pseudomonadota bacterium]
MILLSKLLPIMVYPLGLAIEFIIVAIVMIYRRRLKVAYACLGLSVFVLLFFSNQIVANTMAKKLERFYLPLDENSVKADAIVILGSGVKPRLYPRTRVEFGDRADRVFEGFRLYKAGAAPVIIPTGGGIDFIMKNVHDGSDTREVLIELGAPPDAVLPEDKARNTHENATLVKKLMDERHLGAHILLVTSAMHMPRSVAVFEKAGFSVTPAPADYTIEDAPYTWYSFLPRADLLGLSTDAIKEWLGIAAYKLFGWS